MSKFEYLLITAYVKLSKCILFKRCETDYLHVAQIFMHNINATDFGYCNFLVLKIICEGNSSCQSSIKVSDTHSESRALRISKVCPSVY